MISQQTHHTLCMILLAGCLAGLPSCAPAMRLFSLLNPKPIVSFFADHAYDLLDFTKELHLCPDKPADEAEWLGHEQTDWPGIIFYTPDTHEDLEFYYSNSSRSFLAEDIQTQLLGRGFDPSLPTVIYSHAFTQHPKNMWLRTVRDDYAKLNPKDAPKINLMFYDWKAFAKLGYAGSAKWVPALGRMLATFLDTLVEVTGTDPLKLHLISFSLGTHLCAMAGRQSQHTIGRITALDPAGWCFSERYNHNYTQYGIKATDALQVDVNHFDTNFLGTRLPVGNIDVYMNGGAAQPGCSSGYMDMVNSALTMLKIRNGHSLGQGHSRAAVHSVYTVEDQCHQIAYECPSYEQFQAGECGECNEHNDQCFSTSIYGVQEIWSNWRPPRIFEHYKRMFVNTASEPPFCVHHYQIRVNLKGFDSQQEEGAQAEEAAKAVEEQKARYSKVFQAGLPQIVLQDDNGLDWFATAKGVLEHEWHPLVFTALAMDSGSTKAHRSVRARLVVRDSAAARELLANGIDSVQVNYMSHLDYGQRQRLSTKLCPEQNTPSQQVPYPFVGLSLAEC